MVPIFTIPQCQQKQRLPNQLKHEQLHTSSYRVGGGNQTENEEVQFEICVNKNSVGERQMKGGIFGDGGVKRSLKAAKTKIHDARVKAEAAAAVEIDSRGSTSGNGSSNSNSGNSSSSINRGNGKSGGSISDSSSSISGSSGGGGIQLGKSAE